MVSYPAMLERWLQRLANEDRSARTLEAYRSDLNDTMIDVAADLGVGPTRRQLAALEPDDRKAAIAAALDAIDLNHVTLDVLDGAVAAYRTRPDPRFTKNPNQASRERSANSVARRA